MDNWTVPIPENRLVGFFGAIYKITDEALEKFNINPKYGSTIIEDDELGEFLELCEAIPAVPAEMTDENSGRF